MLLQERTQHALKEVIQQLIGQIQANGQLQEHKHRVSENKQYDALQIKYIQRCKLKKELADQYESSESESEESNEYRGLDKSAIHQLVRKRLMSDNFSEELLHDSEQQKRSDESQISRNELLAKQDRNLSVNEELQSLHQINEQLVENGRSSRNLFALRFLIAGLEQQEAKLQKLTGTLEQ